MTATNALPAEGGRDGESDAEATARIPRLLRARDRAVCAEDFAAIALEVPDVHVGRAQVLPRHMPFQRADGIPGVVTLIVLPAYDPVTPDTPTPDREMLRRVCAYLEPRRLVTTELYVTPPEYCPVDLSIAVEAEAGTGEETLRRNVELGVRQYFAPLPPYGPSGEGWPFGRVVRDRDVEAACLRIAGVRLVNAVVLQGTAIDPDGDTTAVTETLPLRAWQLPYVREVRVAIGPTPDPFGDPPPLPGGMPVPVEKEEC
jgi:predicted phage baseplate assembly protein